MPDAKNKKAPHLTSTEPTNTIADDKFTFFASVDRQVFRRKTLKQILADMPGNSGAVQRERLLRAMQALGNVTTYEGMRYLDCFDPRPRIHELRRDGHAINTIFVSGKTESGVKHRIGLYCILPSGMETPAHPKSAR